MDFSKAEKEALAMMTSGFKHQTYEDELRSSSIFELEQDEFIKLINSPVIAKSGSHYNNVLGPTLLRSRKNGSICLITLVCRIAVDYGVETELSYSLSDYYINKIESLNSIEDVIELTRNILLHYYELINTSTKNIYQKNIARAVRYIERNTYGKCTVRSVAKYVGLEPHYFSALFQKEVHISPKDFIRKRKLKEAKRLLTRTNYTVTQVAEVLGFCDTPHFTKCFKNEYDVLPSILRKRDMKRKTPIENNANIVKS